MSAHTPTNLIRSFRCSAQEGFCAATVSRGSPALERETSYGFIYLEGQPPNEPFQGSILKTLKSFWPFWISNLQVFLSSHVCASLLAGEGGGDEKPSMFRASINELKLISEPSCQTKYPPISLPFLLSLCDTHLFGKGQL